MKFEFDLEQAERDLECMNNLLCTYQEFFDEECPEENDNSKDAQLAALIFARRAHQFHSLIDVVHDKIIAMRKDVTATIAQQSRKSKKGGEAA